MTLKAYTASYLLPITSKPLAHAALVVEDGKIIDIDTLDEIKHRYSNLDIEDCGQSVILPGLVNAHTHLDLLFFQSAQTESKSSFFEELIASWEFRKNQTLNDRRQAIEEGIQQSVRSGTTTLGDVGQFFGMIAQSINASTRMVLFPEILTGGDKSIQEAYEGAFSQVDEIFSTSNKSKVSAGIAPYASYTLSKHLLKILSQQAAALKIPVKIHAAETFSEMQFFYESLGEIADKLFPQMGWGDTLPPPHRKTPIQYLQSIGFLDYDVALVGGNHLSEVDLEILAKTKTKLIHAPRYNAHLDLGHPPLKKLKELGINVALGTEALASKYSLSLWDEMRYIQDRYPENDKLSPKDLLEMATINGARALGMDQKIGSLEKGKYADFIVVHVPKDLAASDLAAWLITHVTPREITQVYVEGKKVKL